MGDFKSFARLELEKAGLFSKESDYGGMVGEAVMELVDKFSAQGHSGFSAAITSSVFKRLVENKPLSPLTGEEDEWIEFIEGEYQNKRCPGVFKKGKDGQAYDMNGKIFREKKTGLTYTSNREDRNSKVPVVFPYTPKSEIVEVDD